VVYRLKGHGFVVSSSQAYGDTVLSKRGEEGCLCETWRVGDNIWQVSDVRDWFDCTEEKCMKRIEEVKAERER
jgi:hypothetical protein